MKKTENSELTTCLDCKKKISKKVKTCPHCGSTEPTKSSVIGNQKRQRFAAVVFIILVIFILYLWFR
jgi:predicted amidophosphoribosyltransferase|tara:strand:+ start:174 stop:374 length:201 start_codon:yes stop_codon:yes gene_type:complete